MINLFAATAHNNYAKTYRLYLQSVDVLEKDHPQIFEQFSFGNHTVQRRYDLVWTLDRSINRADSDKIIERQGYSDQKRMTEITLNVWTKTMHRSAKVIALIQHFMWTCFFYD